MPLPETSRTEFKTACLQQIEIFMITHQKQIAFRRFLAFGIDWLLIMVWAGVVFGMVMLSYSGQPPALPGPWTAQIAGFVSMTLPVILYFSICEASAWKATIGERVLSLRLKGSGTDRMVFSRILL